LVGIVTLPPGEERSGTGWAVPLDLAQRVAADLLAHGHARHVWLGIEGGDAPADGGVVVESVSDESPAAEAGLEVQDRIVSVDDEPVASMADLVTQLRSHAPGDEVDVDYVRDQLPATVEVTLAERS
ncbi:hypothetical protein B7486_54345, partial [cyanobacterium TDX16]